MDGGFLKLVVEDFEERLEHGSLHRQSQILDRDVEGYPRRAMMDLRFKFASDFGHVLSFFVLILANPKRNRRTSWLETCTPELNPPSILERRTAPPMKITILTYLENETSRKVDAVVGQVAAALKERK